MVSVVQKTSIYLNEKGAQSPYSTLSSSQKIGLLWADISQQMKSNAGKKIVALMERLGVKNTDEKAHQELLPMMQGALDPEVEITPDKENTGVYFLSLRGKRFAVFKAGEKRANMELLVRKIAHKAGLEENCVPGIYCTIANPRFPDDETIVSLYNGKVKIYGGEEGYNESVYNDNFGLNEPPTLTGILEPFVCSERGTTVGDLAMITCLSILGGIGDNKRDGMSGARIFDTEDCMPPRLLPKSDPNTAVAATHLPFLDHELARQPIDKETLKELLRRVSQIQVSIFSFLQELEREKVEFPDLAAESLDSDGWDRGGCWVTVAPSPSRIKESSSTIELNDSNPDSFRLLSNEQLDACAQRISHLYWFLRTRVANHQPTSCIDMARGSDPLYDSHLKALERQKKDRHPHPQIAGRISPRDSEAELSREDVKRLRELSRSHSPAWSPSRRNSVSSASRSPASAEWPPTTPSPPPLL